MGLAQNVTQKVESTVYHTGEYRMAGDTSINDALELDGSLSASPVCMTSIDS